MNQGLSGELYVALDQKYVTEAQFHVIFEQVSKTRSKIGGFIKYLLSSTSDNPRRRTKDDSRRRPKAVTKDEMTKDDLTSVSDDEGPRTR